MSGLKIPLLQLLVVYPGMHPSSQCPVSLLHGEMFIHRPLQLLTQSNPYVPSPQTLKNTNVIIYIVFLKRNEQRHHI